MEILVYYSILFFTSILFSIVINWLFLKYSGNWSKLKNDNSNQLRWSAKEKPTIGGLSFFIVFLFCAAILGFLPLDSNFIYDKQIIGIIIACTLGFITGLADDAYDTNPLYKFIGQLFCAYVLIVSGLYIELTGNMAIDFIFTTFWVIGLMNSINMLDNMDGITGTVSASILIGALVLLFVSGDLHNIFILLLLGVLGSLIGFLFFNWNPSRIYMGDTGSQFLGIFLAAVSILFFWNSAGTGTVFQFKKFVYPLLLFIIPLIDTLTVIIRRIMRGSSPFVGGRDHISHHLAYLGLSDRMVTFVLLMVSLFSIPLVVMIHNKVIFSGHYAALFSFSYFLLAFLIFQYLYTLARKKVSS